MNELKHMAEFRSVLADYKPSYAAQQTLKGIKLVLLQAPSAGGRNTIIYRLLETDYYYFIVSDTTREPRVNNGVLEQNGRVYWFRTEEEVLEDLRNGEFLEAEIHHNQQVSGTSIRELENARKLNKIALHEVGPEGVISISRAKPDAIVVFILPPNFDEWLRRLDSRGSMDPAERRRRLETAAKTYQMAATGKYTIIVNDQLDEAVHEVDQLARFGKLDQDQQSARQVAERLYRDTQRYLSQAA